MERKTALVSGASRGIGRAIALELAKRGADVAAVYSGSEKTRGDAESAVRQMEALGVRAKAYGCDVSSFEETEALCKQVLEDFGGVDILVNNAGIVRDGLMLNMREEDYDAVLRVNLKGAFNLIRHLYRQFMQRRSGRIINISSIVGLHGNAGQASYAAAKAGMIGLTKSVAKELAGRNVTCNAIAPGYIESDMTAALPERVRESILAAVPAKRVGWAEDVANVAAFLAMDESGYITGEVIRVDGGMGM